MPGDQLEGVELSQEVPLRPNAGRRGKEGIGLFAHFPREDSGKSPENSKGAVPNHQFPQEKVGKERHPLHGIFIQLRRGAHAVLLDQENVEND